MSDAMRDSELMFQFEDYLRRIGYYSIPNARWLREVRKNRLEGFLRQEHNDLQRLPGAVEQALALSSDKEDRQILEEIAEFLKSLSPPPEAEREDVQIKPTLPAPPVIGRVAPTIDSPASHLEFPFWVRPEAALSIGEIVTAESPDGSTRVVGTIQALKSSTTLRNPLDHFMACDLGVPEAVLPTDVPAILMGTAQILWRSDSRFAPPDRDWALRRATPQEIRQALSGGVDPDYAVPAGFIQAQVDEARTVWVPVDMDLRWLAGYESGHINIAGISGVAAKTSYGLFLAMGMLAAATRQGPIQKDGGLAVIGFNVKEVDLLYLEQVEEWNQAPRAFTDDLDMWQIFQRDYLQGQDPKELFKEFRVWAPGQGRAVATLRQGDVHAFRYGWEDIRESSNAFYALFEPDDLDDRMVMAVEAALADSLPSTWNNLRARVSDVIAGSNREGWVSWGGGRHHVATLNKLINRLGAIQEAMGYVLETSSPSGEPVDVDRLQSGSFWVLDITRLGDRARRFLFFRLLGDLQRRLEERRAGRRSNIPGRVVVFVDELNVFAPGGGGRHPTRERLVHIAARGRSIGLTLLGMQQLASRVDDEVLANTSTLAVGRAHPAELSGSAYAWLRAWRDQVMALPTGSMLVTHPLWRAPVVVRFPRPLHRLAAEARRAEEIRRRSQ
jgi:hypothetical protein